MKSVDDDDHRSYDGQLFRRLQNEALEQLGAIHGDCNVGMGRDGSVKRSFEVAIETRDVARKTSKQHLRRGRRALTVTPSR